MDLVQLGNKYYRILSLDQSTTHTGWALFEKGALIDSGDFIPNKSTESVDERISQTCDFLRKMIEEKKPQVIILEGIQLQTSINGRKYSGLNNVKTFQALAELRGALKQTIRQTDGTITVQTSAPSHWKSVVGIKSHYRREQKQEAVRLVKSKFDLEVSEDRADAICIGLAELID